MINEIIVATNNAHKIEEIKEIFAPYNIAIKSLKDANIESDPEENGTTFKDNAFIKAKAVSEYTNSVIISDDSGLCVHALDDFPGVHSSRFMENSPYSEKWKRINELIGDKEDKSAHFECNICVINLEKEPLFFVGKTFGTIVAPKGEAGFGYDPIFFVEEFNKTFAQISSNEKNQISHRGKALKKLLDYLINDNYITKK